jgi:alpha-amylase
MTDKTIYLPIIFHFHQPVDNFGWVYEDCYEKSYEPLINSIYNVPEVKATLHFSGNLLEWFIKNKPEFIEKLKDMAKRGQIEIIGGGYYEPIFAIIPTRDRIAQIQKLSDLIKKEFGLEVKGAWLSERVWEPNYPTFLNEAGLKYILVDDNHFRSTGLTEEDSFYSYITEDEGKTLRVFPINEPIRYLMPWKPTYMTVDYLRDVATEKGDRVCVFISDAEKMGVWGSTHQICYVEGDGHQEGDNGKPFIPAFLEQIVNNKWIKSITLSEYMQKYPAKNLVYLPTASYDKMEEWVLPTEIRQQFNDVRKILKDNPEREVEYLFLKGGFWRSFLVKYPESNNMHKKMIHVRNMLIEIEDHHELDESEELYKNMKVLIDRAWDEIYKAQCNDCYWHGMFGGVYLQFLRFSVYTHLINAENIMDEMSGIIWDSEDSYIHIVSMDFNKDSSIDVIIQSNLLNAYINPSDGGTIFELDFKPKSYNLLNTLTRWHEAYHDKDKLQDGDIMIDRYRRSMLRMRFFHNDVSLEQLEADTYYEFGDFVDGEFTVKRSEKEEQTAIIEMERVGSIKDPDTNDLIPCTINKTILVEDNKILVQIKGNFDTENADVLDRIIKNINVAVDVPFFFNGDTTKFTWECGGFISEKIKEEGILDPFKYKGSDFKAYDDTYDLKFEIMLSSTSEEISIYKFPIIAFVHTDEGYKRIYQGINVTPRFNLAKSFEIEIELKVD